MRKSRHEVQDTKSELEQIVKQLAGFSGEEVKEWSTDAFTDNAGALCVTGRLVLGETYIINLKYTEDKKGRLLESGFNVYFNCCLINEEIHVTPRSFTLREELRKYCEQSMIRYFGGIDVEHPDYMDYERYTLSRIKDREEFAYFNCIYLALMCHMKERGLTLAPILSKREEIRYAMMAGDMDAVTQELNIQMQLNSDLPRHAHSHLQAEINYITEFTKIRALYHDTDYPLAWKFPDFDKIEIPGKGTPYNILVVDDRGSSNGDHRTINMLSRRIAQDMGKTGRYGGSYVYNTDAYHYCLDLCGTGQVDLVIMGEGYDCLTEVTKAWESLGGRVTVNSNGDKAEMRAGYEEKQEWQQTIIHICQQNGKKAPQFFIVPNSFLDMDLGNVISSALPCPDPLASIRKSLENEHLAEAMEIIDMEERISLMPAGRSLPPELSQCIKTMSDETVHETIMTHLEFGGELRADLNETTFLNAFPAFIGAQLPFNDMDTTKPFDMMRGLQEIDIVIAKYPDYAKLPAASSALNEKLNALMVIACRQITDMQYYLLRPESLANLLGNVYVIVRHTKQSTHLMPLAESFDFNPDYDARQRMTLDQTVARDILPPLFEFLRKTGCDLYSPHNSQKFFLSYGRKLARLTNNLAVFDDAYLHYFSKKARGIADFGNNHASGESYRRDTKVVGGS